MAQINLTFNTTAKQDAKLAKVLAQVNAQRAAVSPPLDPFATIQDYLYALIVDAVKSYVKQQPRPQRPAASHSSSPHPR